MKTCQHMKISDNVIAVILASGSGKRFGSELPKQFCNFLGRPLLMHTIDNFARLMPLGDILLVIDSRMEVKWHELCRAHSFTSPRTVFGGASRTASLVNALTALSGRHDDMTVMIHDGARPLAGDDLIRRMAVIPEGYAGAIPVTPVTDTLRMTAANGDSTTVDRSHYVAVQTPQTFTLGTLRTTFGHYDGEGATDDATMVQKVTGGKIALAQGETTNIKVTNPLDIHIAEAIYRALDQKDQPL